MPRIKKVRTLRPRQDEEAFIDGLICGIKGWAYGCNPFDHLPQHSLQTGFGREPDFYARGEVAYTVWMKPSISERLEEARRRRDRRPTYSMNYDPAEDWTRGWLEGSRQVGEIHTFVA